MVPGGGAWASSMECRTIRVPAGYRCRRRSTCSLLGILFNQSPPGSVFTFTFLLFFFPFLTLAIFLLGRQQALLHLHRVCFNVPAQLGGVAKLPKLLGEGADLRGVRLVAVEFLALL